MLAKPKIRKVAGEGREGREYTKMEQRERRRATGSRTRGKREEM